MPNRPITVINYAAPELNHLAAGLDQSALLGSYVRPYANQGRLWEQRISSIPYLSRLYGRTFGRRLMPEGLHNIAESGIALDMLNAAVRLLAPQRGKAISEQLHWLSKRSIARTGAAHALGAPAVVAHYQMAHAAFRQSTGLKILNYPIAHHRYIQRFVAEESEREPEFKDSLPDWTKVPRWLEPQLDAECASADHILVGSGFARETFALEGIPPDRISVIPYGANLSTFYPVADPTTSPKQGFRILFVGQIGQRKGISYLLRAYRAFHGPETSCTLVGSVYGSAPGLRRYAGLFSHISHLPHGELAERYRQADVFVFPTLIEGMGLVVLEAMASGLPVITTANGPGEIVRDGIDGFIVPIRDPDAIVEKLEYLRANPEHRLEMGRNARLRSQEFSWARYQSASTSLIGSLLEGRRDLDIGSPAQVLL